MWVEPIKDAMNELNEVQVSSEENEEDDSDDEDEDDDDDDDDETMTEKELEVRPPVVDLCKVAVLMLRKASDVLKRLPTSATPQRVALNDEILHLCNSLLISLQTFGIILSHSFSSCVTEISSQIDDTVCSVYRPQVRETVHSNASAVHTSLTRFSQLVLEAMSHLVGDANAEKDKRTVELLIAKSQSCVSKLNDLAQQHH